MIEVVGDVSGLEKSFTRASQSSDKLGTHMKGTSREVQGSIRGVLSASGAFEHLGRSLAFASGGFVATASIGEFIKNSVDAARDAGVVQKSLAAQMKASGQSFDQAKDAIDRAGLSVGKFGFTSDDSAQALTVLERATGKIQKAISLQGLTADVARAKNESLAQAALVVGKVFGGQETALRRAVPGLSSTAHGMDLIRLASQKLAGQAAANTTDSQKFAATLHDTEVIIGDALLPTFNKYLSELTVWLDKANRSGRLQRDVNEALKDAAAAFRGIKSVVSPAAKAIEELGKVTGGTENVFEALAATLLILKARTKAIEFGVLAGGLKGVSTEAGIAETRVNGLKTGLTGLAGKTFVAALVLDVIPKSSTGQSDLDKLGLGFLGHALVIGSSLTQIARPFANTSNPIAANPAPTAKNPFPPGTEIGDIYKLAAAGKPIPFKVDPHGPEQAALILGEAFRKQTLAGIKAGLSQAKTVIPDVVKGSFNNNPALTAAQQLRIALSADPDSIKLLQQQAAHDRSALAFATKLRSQSRISNAKYISEVTGYNSDLVATLSHITSIQTAAAKAAASRIKIPANVSGSFPFPRIAVPDALSGSGVLKGFATGFDIPVKLQLAEAKAEATNNTAALKHVLESARTAAKKALNSGKLTVQAQIEAWQAIGDLNDQLKSQVTGDQTKFKHISTAKLTAGLDLSQSLEKTLRQRLATVGPNGTVPAGSPAFAGAGAGGITVNGDVHVNGVQNVKSLESAMRKAAKNRPSGRRGI